VFAHMATFNEELKQGQDVNVGDFLGFVGSTGASGEGDKHIHWEVRWEEHVRIENGVIRFDNLSFNGYYASSQEELDLMTIDPHIFSVMLATENQ
jgi:murein DD-endopeptidase MepM/ murein hydrolase activator NlpD